MKRSCGFFVFVCFFNVRIIKCYKISKSFCFVTALIATFKTNWRKNLKNNYLSEYQYINQIRLEISVRKKGNFASMQLP